MKIIHTVSRQRYEVTDDQAKAAAEAMLNNGIFHLKTKGIVIKGSAIMEITEATDSQFPDGRWKCKHGHIHSKTDTYCNIPVADPDALKIASSTKLTPEQAEAEHTRQREMMEKVRKDLANKLRWKK
jgi:hypothetical protein